MMLACTAVAALHAVRESAAPHTVRESAARSVSQTYGMQYNTMHQNIFFLKTPYTDLRPDDASLHSGRDASHSS